jgi:type IV pilus assembly protein PilY1
MKRIGFLMRGFFLLMLGAGGSVFLAGPAWAALGPNLATNSDYAASPVFVSNTVQPNVLILMDNSASMGIRAYCGNQTLTANNATCDEAFLATTTYTGMFDPLKCYTYSTANSRYDVSLSTVRTAVETACGSTEWDGNFLNWVGFRRFDAVKRAMIGASCLAARAADGSCPTSGSPAMITLKAQVAFSSAGCCVNVATPAVPNTVGGTAGTIGRVPDAVRTAGATPANLFFIVRGLPTPLGGFFCVDEDQTFPAAGCTSSGGTFTEQSFGIRVSVDTHPDGVLQELGENVRFGLMEFKGNDGIKVLTPIGWRQSVDFTGTVLETFNTNKAAMIDAVEESFPATNTPLGESVYEGARYIAQLNSAFSPLSYVYPIAFSGSGGASFGNAGAGSLGPQERSVLTGSETCPPGYITSACGRDPYFFGSDHSPAWASPSQAVTCCKTFLIVFTDGEPTQDFGVPAALQDYAHAAHGVHCTGSTTSTTPDTTCFVGNATLDTATEQAPFLLAQHKTDYPTANHALDDVAYWAHTTDLRQATIPVLNVPGHDLPGFQNVTVYSFFAFGSINGREILMQAARQGGFEDQNGNNLPDLTAEYDRVNNDTGVLVPDGIPDTYFESQNVDDLRDKLLAAITSILQKAASGTAVSVLATSATGEGAIYQAYFFPTTFVTTGSGTNQVLWTGYTQGLFIDKFGNLREDYSASGCSGAPDGALVLIHDCIIKIRLETNPVSFNFNSVVVDRFKDDGTAPGSTAGDGIADTTTPFETVALGTGGVSNVRPLWEGGRRLALLDPGATCESSSTWPLTGNLTQSGTSCRRILTWADFSNGGGVGGSAGTETLEFSPANAFSLCPYLGGKAVKYCNGDNVAAITAADITADPNLAGCLGITRRGCAQNEATDIINWVRGSQVTGLRDRTVNVVNDAGAQVQAQWKLGDVVNSTPIVVGGPRERFDILYGDTTYSQFVQRYKDRRQVAYLGGNDGMLHAFNAGFFNADSSQIDGTGPPVQVRFTTVPKQKSTSTTCAALPCDASVTTYAFRTDAPPLGAELWAFIPQDLLPQLRWMTSPNYSHVYYVDLTPKITDARIFCNDQVTIANCIQGTNADHPGGWGTILVGGFRLGGSCSNCTAGKGTPRVVNADFNYDGDTTDPGISGTGGSDYRVFLSAYFVLDITNPEKEPTLLWTFRDQNLGLTTSAPAVMRVNPSTDAKTSSTNEKWFVAFGSGPTHHDAFSTQTAQLFVVDLKQGPLYKAINETSIAGCSTTLPCMQADTRPGNSQVRAYPTGVTGAFMADAVTLDFNLDFRVDVVYAGSVTCNGTTTSSGCGGSGPVWRGAMWRLTTNGGDTNPDNWGINTGCSGFPRCPSKLISAFAYSAPQATTCNSPSPCNVGPITTAPALTQDDTRNIWLFFGTGRYYALADKTNTDIQHFFGVKDCIVTGSCTDQSVERNNLFNVSNVVTCSSCAAGANVSTTGSTTSFTIGFSAGGGSLVNTIQNMDGWFTTFNDPTKVLLTPPQPTMTLGERNLSPSTLIGGTVFITTFAPTTEICTASGTGQLYAVFYLTGGPYTSSAVGTAESGSQTLVKKALSLGQGLPSQMAIQIGAQGTGTSGAASSTGCAGRVTGFIQASTGVLGQNCGTPALSFWSRMISWRDL